MYGAGFKHKYNYITNFFVIIKTHLNINPSMLPLTGDVIALLSFVISISMGIALVLLILLRIFYMKFNRTWNLIFFVILTIISFFLVMDYLFTS